MRPKLPESVDLRGATLREYRRRLAHNREVWQSGGQVPLGAVSKTIIQVWEEMRRDSVSLRRDDPVYASPEQLQLRRDDPQLQSVRKAAKKEFVDIPQGIVAIADGRALVLDAWGSTDVLKRAQSVGLLESVFWGNNEGGLNGIGCAATHRQSCVIFAEQHWREDQFGMVCTVCPILHRNRVVAVINVTDFWCHVFPYTLLALQQFANNVERDLGIEGRQQVARMCSVAGWPERITGPALLMDQNGSVVRARGVILEPGDQLTVHKDRIEAGPQWLPELGFCVLEPLLGADGWLVRPVRENDQTDIQVVLDFERPNQCAVRVQGPTVFWNMTITQPQHAAILWLLAHRSPGGLTANALAEALYGDPSRRRDARVLMSRLRKQVGGLLAVDSHPPTDQSSSQLRNKSSCRFGEHVAVQVQNSPPPSTPPSPSRVSTSSKSLPGRPARTATRNDSSAASSRNAPTES
jgi:hypothetical protein